MSLFLVESKGPSVNAGSFIEATIPVIGPKRASVATVLDNCWAAERNVGQVHALSV